MGREGGGIRYRHNELAPQRANDLIYFFFFLLSSISPDTLTSRTILLYWSTLTESVGSISLSQPPEVRDHLSQRGDYLLAFRLSGCPHNTLGLRLLLFLDHAEGHQSPIRWSQPAVRGSL